MLVSYKMIVVDIETSGVDYLHSGIWQIGAVDLSTKEEFFQESRIDEEDSVSSEALLVIGKTEKQLRDSIKQSQKKLLANFFQWYSKRKNKVFIAQNPQFDLVFLDIKAKKYGLKSPFGYRAFDIHTIGALRHMQINGNFLIEKELSGMRLSEIIQFCGLKDTRVIVEKGKIIQKGASHNALEDAYLEAECFSRLVFGKNFLSKYSGFPIPKELKK
jgi:DNA polymerase III epsilon subunit-like protein